MSTRPVFRDVVHGWTWGCGDCGATILSDQALSPSVCPACGETPLEDVPVAHEAFAMVGGWKPATEDSYLVSPSEGGRMALIMALSRGHDIRVVVRGDEVAITTRLPRAEAAGLGLGPDVAPFGGAGGDEC